MFLIQVRHDPFEITQNYLGHSNISKEEWRAIISLANGRSIVIKKADKGSCSLFRTEMIFFDSRETI